MYRDSHHSLSSLSNFLANFPNDFIKHHLPMRTRSDLLWWQSLLARPNISHSLLPLPTLDPDIWVDMSTDWGIGLVVGQLGASWRLSPSWSSHDCNIGWLESVALEIAIYWLCVNDFHDTDVIIHSDNSSVIGAFWKGRSRNASCNDCIACVTVALSASNLSLSLIYVPSGANCADAVSWGH